MIHVPYICLFCAWSSHFKSLLSYRFEYAQFLAHKPFLFLSFLFFLFFFLKKIGRLFILLQTCMIRLLILLPII